MKQNCDGKESGIIEIKKKSINEECKNIIEKKILNDTFIEKSVRKHNLKYDYSKTDYIRSCIKVKIICLLHGLFWMTPNNHLSGKGCPKCKFKKLSDDRSMGINSFIKKSKNSHKELYDYSKANYINEYTKIEIICKKHGPFFQKPSDHMGGHGCPICNSSKGELKIIEFLKDSGIEYKTQKTFDGCKNPKTNQKLKYDFYIPTKNILIEYDGQQHFTSGITRNFIITDNDLEYTKYKDDIKTEYANHKNMKLVRIKYTDFKNIKSILQKEML